MIPSKNVSDDPPVVISDPTLRRSSSGHDRQLPRPGRGQSPGPQPPDTGLRHCGSQNRLCLDSGIASIEDTSSSARSPSTDLMASLTLASAKCNGRLQRTERIDETDLAVTSVPGRLSETEEEAGEETQPLVTSAASLVVPGLQPTQNRCHVQTSGWL